MNHPSPPLVLSRAEATQLAADYRAALAPAVEGFLARRGRGEKHPVEDFLFTYYSYRPAALLRWHPGLGRAVAVAAEPAPVPGASAASAATPGCSARSVSAPDDADLLAHLPGKFYLVDDGAIRLNVPAFIEQKIRSLHFYYQLLAGTRTATPRFGCFGLHEWAMAYRAEKHGVRHEQVPLRLGAAGTNEVVEDGVIGCSHYDAFRFFAPEAVKFNTLQPTRQNQLSTEQPGCLHANMDLYKVAYKLAPLFPGELLAECFQLAWRIRITDMCASPYDLRDWGYEPIRIETTEGKRHYTRLQRGYAAEAQELRSKLMVILEQLPLDLTADFRRV